MSIDIDATAFDAAIDRIDAAIGDEVSKALDYVAATGVRSLQSTSSFNDRTGRLRASFSEYGSETVGSPDMVRIIGTNVPYGYFLEYGTRRIEPRRFVADAREVVVASFSDALNAALTEAIRG